MEWLPVVKSFGTPEIVELLLVPQKLPACPGKLTKLPIRFVVQQLTIYILVRQYLNRALHWKKLDNP